MTPLIEAKMHPITLRFSGELEKDFRDDYIAKYINQIRVGELVGLFFYTIYGVVDAYTAPAEKYKLWAIRLPVCLCIAICIGFSYTQFYKKYIYWLIYLVLLIAGLGLSLMSTIMPNPGGVLYAAGIAQVTLFAFTVFRLRFIWASVTAWVVILNFFIITLWLGNSDLSVLMLLLSFHSTINLIGMLASYTMEYYARKNFVQSRFIQFRTQELQEKNQELRNKNEELNQSREELMRSVKRAEMIFSALSEALPGTVLDEKYRLDQKIGSGGFGTVYRAQHLLLQHPVAVKIFKPGTGTNPLKYLERFRLEGISACRIQHSNAVSVLDFGVSQNSIAYMVMELLNGPSLQEELLKRKRLSIERCAEILIPICSVLAEAHSRGLIHRDIKPSNIILHQTKDSEVVKVVDFGIAKLMGDAANPDFDNLTETGSFVGTPAYMAPERFGNQAYDGKSDVYSVGVMMYEMFCGVLPFQSSKDNFWSVVIMQINQAPQPPRVINPLIPESMEALILRTLEKDPQKRPTAEELENSLSEYRGHESSPDASQAELPDSQNFRTMEAGYSNTKAGNKDSLARQGVETQKSDLATTEGDEDRTKPKSSTIQLFHDENTQIDKEPAS